MSNSDGGGNGSWNWGASNDEELSYIERTCVSQISTLRLRVDTPLTEMLHIAAIYIVPLPHHHFGSQEVRKLSDSVRWGDHSNFGLSHLLDAVGTSLSLLGGVLASGGTPQCI